MITILWFVGIALLFYFMMRSGCGAHVVHGEEDEKKTSQPSNPAAQSVKRTEP